MNWILYIETKKLGEKRTYCINNKDYPRLPRKLKKKFNKCFWTKKRGDTYTIMYWVQFLGGVMHTNKPSKIKMDNISKFNRILTDNEVRILYNKNQGLTYEELKDKHGGIHKDLEFYINDY
jgi:hypothetical protein